MGQVFSDMINCPSLLNSSLTQIPETPRSGVKTRSARKRSAKMNEEFVYASHSAPKLEDDDEYGTFQQ